MVLFVTVTLVKSLLFSGLQSLCLFSRVSVGGFRMFEARGQGSNSALVCLDSKGGGQGKVPFDPREVTQGATVGPCHRAPSL